MREVGGRAVIKPLDLAGGSGVMLLESTSKNTRAIVQLLSDEGRRLVMVQEYLPAVERGDKRILVLDGAILGAINRVPRSDDLRSNIHVGGSVEACEVTQEERARRARDLPLIDRGPGFAEAEARWRAARVS